MSNAKKEITANRHKKVYEKYIQLSSESVRRGNKIYKIPEDEILAMLGVEFYYTPETVKSIIYKQKKNVR